MQIKVLINTASGSAKKVLPYLKTKLLGLNRKGLKYECLTNGDNQIIMEVEGSVKKVLRIQKNCMRFDTVMGTAMKKAMKNKQIRRAYNIDEEAEKQMNEILSNHTKIEIIKEATAAELDSYGRSFWQKLKDKFK